MNLQRFNLKQGPYTFNPSLLANTKTNNTLDPSKMTPQQLWDNATPTVFNNKTSIGQWQKIALSGMTTTNQNQWPVLASLPSTVQPADTAANDDAQVTPAITQLATSLHKNPAEIYKWVYDNIEYIPTYGSIQGSDMTLQTKRGNAFDTSSLLISLLRASGIPARYVYGSIDVNPTILKDWVGGVNNTDAAQNLMGQGGIPNIALTSGSQVTAVRMEHVWVEANVNFNPARGGVQQGATNPNTSTTWIPLDASYKTHTRTQGINLAQAVPLDAQALLTSAQQGTTIDSTNGSVQNLNQANINSALTNYQSQVTAYINQIKPNATVGDVLGTTQINAYKSHMLSPTLPYVVNAVVSDYSTLPDTMKSFFVATVYADDSGTVAFTIKTPTTSLKGQPLALSFNPTTGNDENTIESYLPKPHADGTPVQPSELPSSLPGYLINLTPTITLNGSTLQTGGSFKMGSNIPMEYGFLSPDGHNTPLSTKQLTVGEYYAIGYNLQGMSSQQLVNSKSALSQTKNILQSHDQTQIASLTKDTLTGAILQAVVQNYFAINQAQDEMTSKQSAKVSVPYMSYGTFSTNMTPVLSWGVQAKVNFAGMMMDVDHVSNVLVDDDNFSTKLSAYNKLRGISHSANENLVPEALFNDPGSPIGSAQNVNGVSAVKALALAESQGQKIFIIDKDNIDNVLPQLNQSSQILQDVRDGVSAGKIVTISQTTVTQGGWTGAGYSIVDQSTGAGAYLIGGGLDGADVEFGVSLNGGFVVGFAMGVVLALAVVLAAVGLISAPIAILAGIIGLITGFIYTKNNPDDALYFHLGRLLGSAVVLGAVFFEFGLILLPPIFILGIIYLVATIIYEIFDYLLAYAPVSLRYSSLSRRDFLRS